MRDMTDLDPADPPPTRLRWIASHPRVALALVVAAELLVLAIAASGLATRNWFWGLFLIMGTYALGYAVYDARRGLRRMRQWDARFRGRPSGPG